MQLAEDASVTFPCSTYADYLVAYNPAGTEGGSDLGSKALGAPDLDVVALSANSTLTVAFLGLGGIVDQNGQDLAVHGTVDGEVAVYVGQDETDLVFSGSLTADELTVDVSIASAATVSFVRLVGIAGEASIDAFEAVQTVCSD